MTPSQITLDEATLNSPAFQGWPAPDEYLVELGRLMTAWGGLESGLNLAIGKLAGYNNPGDVRPTILIVHSSFPQRLDSLSSLCEQLKDEFPHLLNYKTVVSSIRQAQISRNKFAHNMIVYDSERKEFTINSISARGKVAYQISSVRPMVLGGRLQNVT